MDWDGETNCSKMNSLSMVDGFSIGRGRGFGQMNSTNDFIGSSYKVGENNNIQNSVSNNNDDDWDEDEDVSTNDFMANGNSNSTWQPSSNSYSSGGRKGDCFNCGESGHMSRECPNPKKYGGGGGNKGCFNCGESGHMSRDCPNPKKSGGGGGDCYNCGESGHMSRDCPNPKKSGGGRGDCFNCGESGHMSRDCPNPRKSGGGGNKDCFNCGESGHMSRDCPNPKKSGGGNGNKDCFNCGESGHMSRDCPNPKKSGGGGKGCFKCGEDGHMARECPNSEGGANSGPGGCFKCGGEGHMARECPNSAEADGDKPLPSTYEPEELPDDEEHLFRSGINSGIHFDKYDNIPVKMSGRNTIPAIGSFNQANFDHRLMANIKRASYVKPTPIQKCAIPIISAGRDIMGCAQTGSGKTAAFLLPIINHMLNENVGEAEYQDSQDPSVVIVAPTRELALQIHNEAKKFSFQTCIKSCVVYGGTAVQYQLSKLMNGCHILVATPGRLMDFVNRKKIGFEKLKFLVLDEADRMLDMGFMPDIKKLVAYCALSNVNKQTLMFSATFPAEIQKLAGEFLNDYIFFSVGQVGGANSDVKQSVFQVGKFDKRQKLVDILTEAPNDRTLVFVGQKRTADFLATYLCQEKFRTTSIHGDRRQQEREEALSDFRAGRRPILTATAVAARGLDIKGVQHVVNYDMPSSIDEYVHRIGRTGRVGNEGKATSFYDSKFDSQIARSLVKTLSDSLQEVPDWLENEAGSAVGTSTESFGRGGFGAKDVRSGHENTVGVGQFESAPDEEDWG